MTSLTTKNDIKKLIELKQEELTRLLKLYKMPSEYKILQMISDKYNICPDLEEKINEYLQRIKMNRSTQIFGKVLYEKLIRGNWLSYRRSGFSYNSYSKRHYYSTSNIRGANYSFNVYGLRKETYHSDCECHYLIKSDYDKEILRELLDMNKIKYLKSDTKHALVCRLLGKNPKDPVYTKEVRKRI